MYGSLIDQFQERREAPTQKALLLTTADVPVSMHSVRHHKPYPTNHKRSYSDRRNKGQELCPQRGQPQKTS